MSKKLIKSYNKILSFLISLLGIGSSFSVTSYDTTAEYGTSYTTFELIGKVTTENNEGCENIRVSVHNIFYASKGEEYEFETDNAPFVADVKMAFSDINRK
jgi:putative lipoprotein (rSAM/lipoprotein system)